jgi:predicted nucleic acid-binding protein
VNVLVDTSVWSLALRRQELLSGVPDERHYLELRGYLRAFPDIELQTADYEEAAVYFNRCRAKGVQGSNTDFLICAVATRRRLAVLTTDADFAHFAKLLPIQLHAPRH